MGDVLLKLYMMLPWPDFFVKLVSWLINPKFCIGVLGIIKNERNEILLAAHTYRGKYPWGLPGGMVGRHEAPQEAIVRELKEELGITVKVLRLLDVIYTEKSIYLEVAYACTISGENPRFHYSAEVSEAKFFPFDELPAQSIRRDQLKSVNQIIAILKATG